MSSDYSYAGLSNVELGPERYDLGCGIYFSRTYAHLMAPHLMAFARPHKGEIHPPPWRAAKGGFIFDITVQLAIPTKSKLPGSLSVEDTAWWIATMLRITRHPYLAVPVFSDQAFSKIAESGREPNLRPFEIIDRILRPGEAAIQILEEADLEWTKSKWARGAELLSRSSSLFSAVRAFDACTLEGKRPLSLLSVWGGLEQLFSPSPGELRYRVSSNIASYLEPPGEKRLSLFKEIMRLYDARSKAAHTASDTDVGPLIQSFVIMRNALVKIIDEGSIPTQDDLERRLFCMLGDI